MAFSFTGWSPAGGNSKPGSAPGMFTYKTTDPVVMVDSANYFAPIRDQLNIGDLIWVVVVDVNGNMTGAGWICVNERTATTVDTTNTTGFTVTDGR